jgi:hypothetical protein
VRHGFSSVKRDDTGNAAIQVASAVWRECSKTSSIAEGKRETWNLESYPENLKL